MSQHINLRIWFDNKCPFSSKEKSIFSLIEEPSFQMANVIQKFRCWTSFVDFSNWLFLIIAWCAGVCYCSHCWSSSLVVPSLAAMLVWAHQEVPFFCFHLNDPMRGQVRQVSINTQVITRQQSDQSHHYWAWYIDQLIYGITIDRNKHYQTQ